MSMPVGSLNFRTILAHDAIDQDCLLGAVSYGADPHPVSFGSVPMQVLPDGGTAHTAWFARGPFVAGSHGKLQYRYDDQILFGFVVLNEADFPATCEASSIQQISLAAYSAIFGTLDLTGFRYLVRCWNYLPRINEVESGLERYRQFNIGRQDAFIAAQRSHLAGSPSACALGTINGGLVVYFLASHAEPQAIENPRQMSAYHYPDQYGPRKPTFSRGTLLPLPGMEALFISGTASIVGHETLHHEDVLKQTAEVLRNIQIVVAQANLKSHKGEFAVRDLHMKVFIRHWEDREAVAAVMHAQLGDNIDVIWLHADICRAELLVEIEAYGCLDATFNEAMLP